MKKILFVYRTKRIPVFNKWKKKKGPDSLLFGSNHFDKLGYKVDYFDTSYSPLNIFHPIYYPLEQAIINTIGMGFKLDQASILFPKFHKYDAIVATGDSAGLPVLFLKHLKLINNPIIYMTAGLAGAIKGKTNTWVGSFYKKILQEVNMFTAYSQVELDFFSKDMNVNKKKMSYMPLGTDWQYFSSGKQQKREIISAIGVDSGRDYKTFFKAIENINIQAEIACHPSNIQGLKIPKNVKVHLNIPVEQIRSIFNRSITCVVPCFERFRSAGQMVVLESSSAKTPVIASKIRGLTTAFDFEDKKHLLYTKPEDPNDLREKILYTIKNRKKIQQIGAEASKMVRARYTTEHLAKRLGKFIGNI